jgi:signal transduction histidine kinase
VKVTSIQDDRQRLAGDLHDRVIQRLFGAGLSLQGIAGAANNDGLSDRLNAVITEIDDTIREIRSTIFELSLIDPEQGIRAQIIALLRELSQVVGFEVRSAFDGPVDAGISDDVAEHLLATVREAVTNIGRHADATKADVLLSVHGDLCRLQVSDNGRGMGRTGTTGGGLGLNNMRRRAEKLQGHLELTGNSAGGTTLDWQVLAK